MMIDKSLIGSIYDKVNETKAESLTYKQLNVLVEVFGKIKELEEREFNYIDNAYSCDDANSRLLTEYTKNNSGIYSHRNCVSEDMAKEQLEKQIILHQEKNGIFLDLTKPLR